MARLAPSPQSPLGGDSALVSELQPTTVSQDAGWVADQGRVCQGQGTHHRASAMLSCDVRQSKPGRRKRGDDALGWCAFHLC